ncbi:hypothetical protein ACIGKL_17100 [Pseudomonas sp. NPDC077186]|uniref:hypothetical protein n=1 Tax=Pseudomonas sp. NPDC077186 TaxID=3364421 RepID=UPI0037C8B115
MKLPFFTPGRMRPTPISGEAAPRRDGDAHRRKACAAGDRMLCIYLAQNPGLTRRYMELN